MFKAYLVGTESDFIYSEKCLAFSTDGFKIACKNSDKIIVMDAESDEECNSANTFESYVLCNLSAVRLADLNRICFRCGSSPANIVTINFGSVVTNGYAEWWIKCENPFSICQSSILLTLLNSRPCSIWEVSSSDVSRLPDFLAWQPECNRRGRRLVV